MSGYLSQAVCNLLAAEARIRSFTGLPPEAEPLQADSAALVHDLSDHVRALQPLAGGFVRSVDPQLRDVEQRLANGAPVPPMKEIMDMIRNEAAGLQTNVNDIMTRIRTASTRLDDDFARLTGIEAQLSGQTTSLQSQLAQARTKEAAAKKRYYYLLALGPLGLAGLAAALALYLKWQSDVNGYEHRIAALKGRIDALAAMNLVCRQLGTGFSDVGTKVAAVKNTVDFLVGDILAIDADLDEKSAPAVIRLKVLAASAEVATLGVDAS